MILTRAQQDFLRAISGSFGSICIDGQVSVLTTEGGSRVVGNFSRKTLDTLNLAGLAQTTYYVTTKSRVTRLTNAGCSLAFLLEDASWKLAKATLTEEEQKARIENDAEFNAILAKG